MTSPPGAEAVDVSDQVDVFLVRHAKSAWPDGVADRERPLSARGERNALDVGRFLSGGGAAPVRGPEVVLASPALRAFDTARLLVQGWGVAVGVRLDERIYDDDVVDVVEEHVPGLTPGGSLVVVGHEPGVVDAVRVLSGARVRVPTGCLLWLTLSKASPLQGGVLRVILPPRLLTARASTKGSPPAPTQVTAARRSGTRSAKNS